MRKGQGQRTKDGKCKDINPREEIHNNALVGITRKVYDKWTVGKNRKQKCHSRNKGTKPHEL
jgi:hypothetical protein